MKPTVLRVGQASTELRRAHAAHRTSHSAFLTACNPYSESCDAQSNAARQAALSAELRQCGQAILPGVGQHLSNGSPGEDSVLAFGLGQQAPIALGLRLQQHALIWSGINAKPELVVLPRAPALVMATPPGA